MPLQDTLSGRFDNLPLIICGPMVRRVEPEIVSVWVALKTARFIELELYAGYCTPTIPDFPGKTVAFKSAKTPTLKIGEHLHLALITVESPGLFTPGGIFSYDLLFYDEVNKVDSLITLQQNDASGTPKTLLQAPHLLGFKEGQLPSFIVPPAKLENLRIAHGSCRKPYGQGRDALATLAEIMEPDFTDPDRILDPIARPHIFFHTGDQIYADSCSDFLIQHYTDSGNFLLQKIEQVPFPSDPEKNYSKQGSADSDFVWMQVTSAALPPGRRATNFYSGFTGAESNHLHSFAEYAAAYLFQWCDALWPKELPTTEQVFLDKLLVDGKKETDKYLLYIIQEGDRDKHGELEKTPVLPKDWYTLDDSGKHFAVNSNQILKDALESFKKGRQRKVESDEPAQKERVEDFRKDLKAVRRVLANVPSIMSFDDHDITDDWYLNGGWSKQALGTRLGETIIRNGLLAYALFQAWGNDPKGWAEVTTAKYHRSMLLKMIPEWISSFSNFTDEDPLISPARNLNGPDLTLAFHEALAFDNFEKPFIQWNCFLKISEASVFVLDTRTRRDFSSGLNFPPNLIGSKALAEQIPDTPIIPTGIELAIVISGAPVLGLAAIESIGQPIVPRVLDFLSMRDAASDEFNVKRRKGIHKGRDSLDVEHWSLHQAGFEAFLKRCATLKKVLFLAGDVHYGITSEMDYWVKGEPEAARFVQMVSSSLKNIRPEGAIMGILPSGIAEAALAGGLNMEFVNLTSIGWEDPDDIEKLGLRAQTQPGQFVDARPSQYPIRIAYTMEKKPLLLTLRDWPLIRFDPEVAGGEPSILNRIVFKKESPEPSFRWRMNVLQDERPDSERFESLSTRPADLSADLVPGVQSGSDYETKLDLIFRRAAFYSRTHINRIVNWYSHVAIIDFVKKDGNLATRQSMFFKPFLESPDENSPGTYEQPFVLCEASLNRKPVSERPDFPLEPNS
ncbi:MAG: hypothetical protein ABI760_01095 [Ferruginibacter sp.]